VEDLETLVPNDGGVFQPQPAPAVQAEIAEERAMIKSAEPYLGRISAFLDEQIAQAGDIMAIDIRADDVKSQLIAQRLLQDRLYVIKNDLENLKAAHLDKS
jgi:hypothetical protein